MRQALFCLIGSTSFTLVVSLSSYWAWTHFHQRRIHDEANRIVAIIQTGPEKEALKTSYLAELLGLSADHPSQIYAFDLKKAEQKLLASPLIQSAKIKRLPPNTLYIDYELRRPIARLIDYQNLGIDRDGYVFPIHPFFSPKNLAEVYLGLPAFGAPEDAMGRQGGRWLTPIKNKHLHLAFEILQFLEGSSWREGLRVKRIDVSNAFAPSLGQREIVLFTEEELSVRKDVQEIVCVFPKILRLAPKEYGPQLNNFFALKRNMMEDYRRQLTGVQQSGRFHPRIIDLRIPQLAFVQNQS